MKSKPRVNNLSDVIGPPTVTVQVSKTESAQAYRGIKRGAGLHASWVVHYRGKNALFFDRDYDFNWRQSLFAAEEYMRSVYVPPGSVFGKPKCTLVKVKRPYSKDPSDLIERVRLSRFGGGYKFFDLDLLWGSFWCGLWTVAMLASSVIALTLAPNPAFPGIVMAMTPVWLYAYNYFRGVSDEFSPLPGAMIMLGAIGLLISTL